MQSSYGKEALLVADDALFTIELFDDEATEFKEGCAYLKDDYFYLWRGEAAETDDTLLNKKPGIYKDPETNHIYLVEPITDDEKDYYLIGDKISSIDPEEIVDIVNENDEMLVAVSSNSKLFRPEIELSDDILKRITKIALLKKNVEMDQLKDRFINSNAFFNFKQSINKKSEDDASDKKKKSAPLSMLLFDRGCEAMNLKYRIILEEKDPNNTIGEPLVEEIECSSEDTYEL